MAALRLEPIEGRREEPGQQLDDRSGAVDDPGVRAVVDGEAAQGRHRRLAALAVRVEERAHVGEAEADAARDGLRGVAAQVERVLVVRHLEQQGELRLRQVLALVDEHPVERRVARLLGADLVRLELG